jgi:hypothetical protein
LIDEALRQGDRVLLLHRDSPSDHWGEKAYQWADPAAVPRFLHGQPDASQFTDAASFYTICQAQGVDAIVTLWTYGDTAVCEQLRDEGVAWIALQHAHEFHVFPAEMVLRADVLCMFSEWWIELVERYFPDVPRARSREHIRATGWPQLDSMSLVDRAAVRKRLGVPDGAPIVTLATYKQHAYDAWEQLVFRSRDRLVAGARVLLHGRPRLLGTVRSGVLYADLLRSIRSFCDRNGAFFLSKARGKDRPPELELKLADASALDESYYPATIMEVVAVTDVSIGFFSTSTLESVFAGAYSLCPVPPRESAWLNEPMSARFRELARDEVGRSLWDYPGLVEQRTFDDFVWALPHARLADMRPDSRARQEYIDRFLGGSADHARRTWEAVAMTVERKRATR